MLILSLFQRQAASDFNPNFTYVFICLGKVLARLIKSAAGAKGNHHSLAPPSSI